MSSCICKQKKSSSIFKKAFLSKVIVRSKEISIYENCFKCNLRSYTVSLLDSTRYIEYVCSNRSRYNVLGPITTQLETLSSTHVCLKTELEDTLEK